MSWNPKELELEVLRRMTPAQKLAAMHSMIRLAYDLKVATLRAAHPDLSDGEVWARACALVAGDRR